MLVDARAPSSQTVRTSLSSTGRSEVGQSSCALEMSMDCRLRDRCRRAGDALLSPTRVSPVLPVKLSGGTRRGPLTDCAANKRRRMAGWSPRRSLSVAPADTRREWAAGSRFSHLNRSATADFRVARRMPRRCVAASTVCCVKFGFRYMAPMASLPPSPGTAGTAVPSRVFASPSPGKPQRIVASWRSQRRLPASAPAMTKLLPEEPSTNGYALCSRHPTRKAQAPQEQSRGGQLLASVASSRQAQNRAPNR